MRKGMFSLLSVLALVFVFTGCNTSSGTSSTTSADTENESSAQPVTPGTDTTPTTSEGDTIVVNGQEVAADSNTFGVSDTLGTPPELPAN